MLENQNMFNQKAQFLFDQGLLRQDEDGAWITVETLEEKNTLMNQRQAEASKAKLLDQ